MTFFEPSIFDTSGPSIGLLPKCGACGLHKTCTSPKMKITGLGGSKILIVGEAPGEREDSKNEQFVGKSGKYLESMLDSVGVRMREDCILTNALICRPPNNETPTEDQIGYCQPNLKKTIKEEKPHVILTVGRSAIDSVLRGIWTEPLGPMNRWAGWLIPCRDLNTWIVPTYHPSYVLRELEVTKGMSPIERIFRSDLRQVAKLYQMGRPHENNQDLKDRILILTEEKDVVDFIYKIREEGKPFAFDYETNMLKPDKKSGKLGYGRSCIHSASVCNSTEVAASFSMMSGRVQKAWSRLLKSRCPKIAHNLKFEDRWSRANGWVVQNWIWDTMNMAHVIDNRKNICSLSFQSFVNLGIAPWGGSIGKYFEAKGSYANNKIKQVNLDQLLLYNGMDSLATFMLAEHQMELLNQSFR